MTGIENKLICLNLNANWQPIGFKTVKDAIVDLCGCDVGGKPATLALDIDYNIDDFGDPILTEPKTMNPVSWTEWLSLPVRPWDLSINSAHMKVRVPTVIIAVNFSKMPVKQFKNKPSKDAIYVRDGGIDQYTGKKLDRNIATVDHVIPRSKGGGDTWENLVLCSKDINSKKGNRFNNEVGLKLLKNPTAPQPVPVYALIKDARHVDWQHFLIKT
jgi:5-methylcytosine-specific restriction endonuclease McrA